jgi:O-antigen biosynthesis protein WbqP
MRHNKLSSMLKRLFDFIVSLIGLIFVSPILVCIAILIKREDGGPVFYRGLRIGLDGKPFRIFKFRTMVVNAEKWGGSSTADDDPGITKVGRFLRKYKLDELPQLWSVLRGDMSFVGPRPALYNQDNLVALRTEKGIHKIIPGITGWAQVNGRDDLPIPIKVGYDEYYLKNRSFSFDMKILFLTLFKTVKSEGVQH